MRPMDRVVIVCAMVAALAVGAVAGGLGTRRAVEPPTAKVATCDMYKLLDKLVQSDRFKPAIEAEGEKIKAELTPLEDELKAMAERLQGMQSAGQQDAEAQQLLQQFGAKREQYTRLRQERESQISAFVAEQYAAAYDLARSSVERVATDLGYTHVLASRGKDEKLEKENTQRFGEALLARPMVFSPEGSDITDDVMKELRLE